MPIRAEFLSTNGRREIASFLKLSMPLVGAQVAQISTHAIDVLMIGRLGAQDLAASILGFHFLVMFWLTGVGLVGAVVPLAGSALGRLDLRLMRRVVRMGLWIAVSYALFACLILWHAERIFLLFGQNPELAARAGDYIRLQLPMLAPLIGFVALRNFLILMELTPFVLLASLATMLVNALGNYILIFGNFGAPRMELAGAAIATDIATFFGFGVLVAYLMTERRVRRFAIFGRIWRADPQIYARIFWLGLPIGLSLLAESLLFSISSIFLGWIGTIELAAHGIALQLASITFMVPLALGQAATARVSIAHGRRDHAAIARAAGISLGLAVAFMVVSAAVFWLFPHSLIGLFLSSKDADTPAIIMFGASYLAVAAIFQLFDGLQVVTAFLLRGLADTTIPMVISVAGYGGFGLGSAYVMGFVLGYGGVGVWIGLLIGLAFAAVCLLYRFSCRNRLGLLDLDRQARQAAVI